MIKFSIPVKTVSPNRVRGNTRLAAIIHSARKKKEREAARLCTMIAIAGTPHERAGWIIFHKDFVDVKFTRVSAGKLDAVNLAASLKHVEDGVAAALKVDDGSSWWHAEYAQRKGKQREYAVEVEIA